MFVYNPTQKPAERALHNSISDIDAATVDRALAIIGNFKKDWTGRQVDNDGLLHIANETGQNTPLLWCFNDTYPFERLAKALGKDQPLIGLRSAHLTRRTQFRSSHLDFAIADRYSQLVTQHFPNTPMFVGGNCQGANIASRIRENFGIQGTPVPGGFHMESCDLHPFAGPQVMLFGEDSYEYNPYLRGENPFDVWRSIFREPSVKFLPGGHGDYFSDDNIRVLTDVVLQTVQGHTLQEKVSDSQTLVAEFAERESAKQSAGKLAFNCEVRTAHAPNATAPDRLALYAFWHCLERLDAQSELVKLAPSQRATPFELILKAPAPGKWSLTLYPVIEGYGPTSVAEARQRALVIHIAQGS